MNPKVLLFYFHSILTASVAYSQTIVVTSTSSPSNGGTVSYPYYGTTIYNNTLVPNYQYFLSATPVNGYYFSGWSGDSNSSDNPLSFIPTSNFSITANFKLLSFAVSTEVIGDGNATGAGNYSYGSKVNMDVNNSNTSTFLGWDTNNTTDGNWSSAYFGYYLNQTTPLSVQISQNVFYKAYFSNNVYPSDNNLTTSFRDFLSSYPYALYFSGIPLTKNPEQLTQAHLEGVSYFTAPSNGKIIKNLEGIQYAKNLQSIVIKNNGINDISPLLNLGSLTTLDLSGGGTISSLEGIEKLVFLQNLNLEKHRISSLSSLATLPYLSNLKIKENFLDLANITIQTEIANLRYRYATVEVEQQIPVPIQNLSLGMASSKEKLKLNYNDPQSNLIYSLELILNLLEDNSSNSLKALALSLGASQEIKSFSLPDAWLQDLNYGKDINPTFNFSEIEHYLKDTFVVTLEIAYLYLSNIPDSTPYITLTQDFTGLEQVLYADMGDVYLLKSMIKALIGTSQIILSYDWPMTGLTAKQMHDSGLVNLESLFDSSNQFGALKKTNFLAESRENFKEAITFYKIASAYLRSSTRITQKGFFNLDSSDLIEEEKFRKDLDNAMLSLDFRIDLNNSDTQNDVLHLKKFFLGNVDLSDAMPAPVGNKFESSTVQDPTFGGILPFWTAETLNQQLLQADLITSDAMEGSTDVENAQNWKQSSWLGYFFIPNHSGSGNFWMYHLKLGWLYLSSKTPANIWLFHQTSGTWLWTKKSSFPYLYSQTDKTWYYLLQSGKMVKWENNSWNMGS